MKVILQVKNNGFSKIYLEPCIYLSILSTIPEYNEWALSNFMVLCAGKYEKGDLIYRNGYVKIFYHTTRIDTLRNWFNINYYSTNITATEVLSYIKNEILHRKYIIIELDEFFITNTYYFNRHHYYRKFLIYGFDSNKELFYTMSHDKNTNYSYFELESDQIYNIYKYQSERNDIPNKGPIAIQSLCIKKEFNCTFSLDHYLNQFNDMLYNKKVVFNSDLKQNITSTFYYGIQMYDIMKEAYNAAIYNMEKIDFRALGILAEHKMHMIERLLLIIDKTDKQELMPYTYLYKDLRQEAMSLMLLIIRQYKENFEKKHNAIVSIVSGLERIKCKEKLALEEIIQIL